MCDDGRPPRAVLAPRPRHPHGTARTPRARAGTPPGQPRLEGTSPCEKVASLYGAVLYDAAARQLRIWYLAGPNSDASRLQVRGRPALGNITLCGYATSDDRVRWHMPIIDQLDVEASTANTLVDIGRTNREGIAITTGTIPTRRAASVRPRPADLPAPGGAGHLGGRMARLSQRVVTVGDRLLPALAGCPLRRRFRLRQARLFSHWFA